MPDHKTHYLYDCYVFGKVIADKYHWVHSAMDHPWTKIYGPAHRKINHNQQFVDQMTYQYGPIAGAIARNHISLDLFFTKQKRLTKEREDKKNGKYPCKRMFEIPTKRKKVEITKPFSQYLRAELSLIR